MEIEAPQGNGCQDLFVCCRDIWCDMVLRSLALYRCFFPALALDVMCDDDYYVSPSQIIWKKKLQNKLTVKRAKRG